jgi:hypothetical protein
VVQTVLRAGVIGIGEEDAEAVGAAGTSGTRPGTLRRTDSPAS